MPEYLEAIELLDTIPGVSRQLATMIGAEIGIDMSCSSSDSVC
jgi:hypothetical protein